MKRRDFIAGLGAAAAWPVVGWAQQPAPMRRVSVLMYNAESDPEGKAHLVRFTQSLAEFGWINERNLQFNVRWAAGDVDRMRLFAKELVDFQPDVILSESTPITAAFHRETRTIPIVLLEVSDPVGSNFIASLARPGGNITGFIHYEPSMGGKWLELLMQIAPGVKRVAAMFNPETAPYVGPYYLSAFNDAAQSFKIAPIVAPVRDDIEIESVIASLGREPGGGLVVLSDAFMVVHRAPIISLAALHKVPAVYFVRGWVGEGALLSYGAEIGDLFRRAASYVDRILKGERPGELPVQLPTKFEMAVNVKTATALDLTVPPSILVGADEVIE
jgi:putative tryptophan/tyrosine transport system substrate-binding protein